jgi:hypothetical protein
LDQCHVPGQLGLDDDMWVQIMSELKLAPKIGSDIAI